MGVGLCIRNFILVVFIKITICGGFVNTFARGLNNFSSPKTDPVYAADLFPSAVRFRGVISFQLAIAGTGVSIRAFYWKTYDLYETCIDLLRAFCPHLNGLEFPFCLTGPD